MRAEARLDVPDSHKIGNPNSAYSWQLPPVTKCGQVSITDTGEYECQTPRRGDEQICPDCNPCRSLEMHLQQNKEVK